MTIDNQWSVFVQVAILVGVALNIGYAVLKHRWEVQDLNRRAAAVEREVDRKAEEVKVALELRNARLVADLEQMQIETRHRDELARQREEIAVRERALLVLRLAENTAVAKEASADAKSAYKEANSVNAKIAETNQRAVTERQEDKRTAEHIRDTTDNLHDMAQQYIVQQAPGGERALPEEAGAAEDAPALRRRHVRPRQDGKIAAPSDVKVPR